MDDLKEKNVSLIWKWKVIVLTQVTLYTAPQAINSLTAKEIRVFNKNAEILTCSSLAHSHSVETWRFNPNSLPCAGLAPSSRTRARALLSLRFSSKAPPLKGAARAGFLLALTVMHPDRNPGIAV